MTRIRFYERLSVAAVAGGISFSVLLISIAFGVQRHIHDLIANPVLHTGNLVDVDQVNRILLSLTTAVTGAMLAYTVGVTYVLAQVIVNEDRHRIAVRLRSGAKPRTLLGGFCLRSCRRSLSALALGESLGVGAAVAVNQWTSLPTALTVQALYVVGPLAALLSVTATLWPAWAAAKSSPFELEQA